jgi:hypothetical protein
MMTQPDPFLDGFRLIDGTNLNEALANPEWSVSQNPNATTGGTVTTSRKIVDTITEISVVGATNAGVALPTALPGRVLLVINSSLLQIVVYAEGGSTINGIPGSVGLYQQAFEAVLYTATEVGNWVSMPFVALNANQTEIRVLTNITTLRAQTIPAPQASAQVSLIYNTVVNDGGGIFYLDATDVTSPDNGTTIIVDAVGNRWKRELVQAAYIAFAPTGVLTSTSVQGAIAEVMTRLAASSGSSLVGFIQGGSGAVARTAQAKMRDEINVRDFGALGDGTDQTAAIQAAFTYAGVNGKVIVPPGSYFLSATINCPASLVIEGAGPNQTLFWRTGNYGSTLAFTNAGAAQISGIWFWHGLPRGGPSLFESYVANTTATSGYPGDGKIIWNNAAQATATTILIAEKDANGNANPFLPLVYSGQEFQITQPSNPSAPTPDYQKWTVTGAPTNVNPGSPTSYWSIPVTLAFSSGVGTTNFANNSALYLGTGGLINVATSGAHIDVGNCQALLIEDCWLWRMQWGILLYQGSIARISRCSIQGVFNRYNTTAQESIAAIGVGLANYVVLLDVVECYLGGNDAGIQKITWTSVPDANTVNQIFLGNNSGPQSGLLVYGVEGLLVTGCYIGGQAFNNINLSPNTILSQVRIHNNFFDGAAWDGRAISITPQSNGPSVGQFVMSDNTFNLQIYCKGAMESINPFGTANVLFNYTMVGNSFSNCVGTPIVLRRTAGGVISGNNFTGYNCYNVSNTGANADYAYGLVMDTSTSVTIDGNIFGGAVNSAIPGGFTYGRTSLSLNTNVVEKNSMSNGLGLGTNINGRVDKTVALATTNYNMTSPEDVLLVNAAAPVNVTLPTNVPDGYVCEVKDISGTASTNNITITNTVDGVVGYLLSSNYQSVRLISFGGWRTLGDGRDLISNSATQGVGFGTGAGGTVTQLTSRTTPVSLNTMSGAITLFSAAGSATAASFTVNNTSVAAADTIIVNQKSGTDKYVVLVTAVAANSFEITFYTTGGTTVEQPVFNFSVIKGSAS